MLRLSHQILGQLRALAVDARPHEIVGFLAGNATGEISTVIPLENIAVDTRREYFASFESMARAWKHMRTTGLELIAIYHSHPNGPALPSRTDLERAQWVDLPMLIIDAATLEVRAWWLEGEGHEEVIDSF
jgi:[CysO sulfur-carrier protein]-S-L-cysteine hydrolase